MCSMASLDERVNKIRDLINEPRTQHLLRKDPASWQQLCSSLDVIGDSEMAIQAFVNSIAADESTSGDSQVLGILYLNMYGVLQALFLQQDAIRHACEALSIPLDRDASPKMKEIRDIRNASAGHPTRHQQSGRPVTYHGIARVSLTSHGFSLYSFTAAGTLEVDDVDLPELVAGQTEEAARILEAIVDELERQLDEHRRAFASKKLSSAFPGILAYQLEKILTATHSAEDFVRGSVGLDFIEEALRALQELLAERDVELNAYEGAQEIYDSLAYPLSYLRDFFSGGGGDSQQAYINARFLREELGALGQFAEQIDREYSS